MELVIGNGSYQNAPLKNPVNDARDMAAALKSLGFEVMLKTDANKRTMLRAINTFGKVGVETGDSGYVLVHIKFLDLHLI
jgi:uncharacterized caspase-like protein